MKRILTLSLSSLLACGGGTEAPPSAAAPPATAAAPAVVAAPAALASASQAFATLGGTVIALGQKLVEVLPLADGSVRATLMDAQGALLADPAATVTVQVQGDDGQAHPVALSWDAEAGVYAGSVAADVTIQPGPVQVVVASGGEAATARAERVSVAPVATHGGSVMVAGDRGAEVRVTRDGKVEAWVAGEDGAFLTTADEGAAITVQVGADGAVVQPVTLTWNTEAGHYVGRARGVTFTETTPVQLSVTRGQVNGQTRVASVQVASGRSRGGVRVGVRADGKPPTVDIGNAAVQVNVPGAQVQVGGGSVQVRAPGVNVNVMGGAVTTQQGGMVQVRVGAPRPSGASVSVMASSMAGGRGPAVRVGGGGGIQINGAGGIHIGN